MIHADTQPRLTDKSTEHGLGTMLVCIAGCLIAWLAMTGLLSLAPSQSFSDASANSRLILTWGAIIVFFATWTHDVSNSGNILLDCGPPPARWMLVLSVFWSSMIALGCAYRKPSFLGGDSLDSLIFASLTLVLLTGAQGRLQFSEHGLWTYSGLVRWQKIESYCWEDNYTLFITLRNRFILKRRAIPISPHFRDEVTTILEK
ncbi:MAG: hypothetical protein HOI66_08120, partial [Verrucomicrobia bacterium]|nr:hypothetical protein [Verrucomicrobiota bacterium]